MPVALVETMAGMLRWSLGSHLGFLNLVKRGGGQLRLPLSVALQTPGHTGRVYDYQNPQSHLLWAFFAFPFSQALWAEGSGEFPLNLHHSCSRSEVREVNVERRQQLAKAYERAREELGISEEEGGRLVRISQFEWLFLLSPAPPTEKEQLGIKLIKRTSEFLMPQDTDVQSSFSLTTSESPFAAHSPICGRPTLSPSPSPSYPP